MSGPLKKEQKFFRMFDDMGRLIEEAAELLCRLVSDPAGEITPLAARIRELEHAGDELSHRIVGELNRTFIAPLDREDIHDLASALDDVLDVIDATAARTLLFHIRSPIHEGAGMARLLSSQVSEIAASLRGLEDTAALRTHCIEINRLENEADRLYQSAIGRLFDEVKDPIEVIKRKEITEMLESATDKAEDVAVVLERLVIRPA